MARRLLQILAAWVVLSPSLLSPATAYSLFVFASFGVDRPRLGKSITCSYAPFKGDSTNISIRFMNGWFGVDRIILQTTTAGKTPQVIDYTIPTDLLVGLGYFVRLVDLTTGMWVDSMPFDVVDDGTPTYTWPQPSTSSPNGSGTPAPTSTINPPSQTHTTPSPTTKPPPTSHTTTQTVSRTDQTTKTETETASTTHIVTGTTSFQTTGSDSTGSTTGSTTGRTTGTSTGTEPTSDTRETPTEGPSEPQGQQPGNKNNTPLLAGVIAGVLGLLILLSLLGFWCFTRRLKHKRVVHWAPRSDADSNEGSHVHLTMNGDSDGDRFNDIQEQNMFVRSPSPTLSPEMMVAISRRPASDGGRGGYEGIHTRSFSGQGTEPYHLSQPPRRRGRSSSVETSPASIRSAPGVMSTSPKSKRPQLTLASSSETTFGMMMEEKTQSSVVSRSGFVSIPPVPATRSMGLLQEVEEAEIHLRIHHEGERTISGRRRPGSRGSHRSAGGSSTGGPGRPSERDPGLHRRLCELRHQIEVLERRLYQENRWELPPPEYEGQDHGEEGKTSCFCHPDGHHHHDPPTSP